MKLLLIGVGIILVVIYYGDIKEYFKDLFKR